MKKTVFALLASSVAVSACAEKSASIPPSYVSRSQYDTYSCADIRAETDDVVDRLNSLSGAQDKKASSDAVLTGVGIVLFWPALIFTSGAAGSDDYATEIGQLKGRAEALQSAYRANGCARAA